MDWSVTSTHNYALIKIKFGILGKGLCGRFGLGIVEVLLRFLSKASDDALLIAFFFFFIQICSL